MAPKKIAPAWSGHQPEQDEKQIINKGFYSHFFSGSQELRQAALSLLQSSISAIPADPVSKKATLNEWKPYQSAPISRDNAELMNWPGIAVIAGKVSRNLEVLDFDFNADWFSPWAEIVEDEAPGLVDHLLRQNTQSGGKHLAYRCPGIEIPGNQKLASGKIEVDGAGEHEFHGKRHRAHQEGYRFYIYPCFIETRGEGGYFLVDPTPGYVLENGDFLNLPEITPAERELLIRAAKAQNRYVKAKHHRQPTIDGDRPGDLYNEQADVRPLLEKHGWAQMGGKGDFEHYTRPGKRGGVSASLIDGKLFHVFTSNAPPLEQWTAYTPFALYATLEHGGDFETAAKELRRQGYGAALENGPATNDREPEPLPDELLPVAPFDFALLPDSLSPWVKDICDRMQCPPDFVAAGIMAALGGVIGRKVAIRPQARTDWTVICNIWALIVGRPGVLKSPALEQALATVNRLAAIAVDRYQKAEIEYQAEAQAAKLKKEAAEKQARGTLKKNPNADLSSVLSVVEPAAPQLKRYMANDTSPASLGELLRQNPNGLLVYRDEIVSLLKSLDREGQEEGRGFYLTGWNGDTPYTFDRIGRGLNLHIPAVCLSVLGGTQPGRLSEYIRQAVKGGAADDGLIQRFGLLVWPDTGGKWQDVDRWPDTDAKNKAFKVFDYLDNINPLEIGAEQGTGFDGEPEGPPFLRFEPAALEAFQEWRTNLEKRLRGELHPALESHFAKYRKLIPAFALICHLADGDSGQVTEKSTLRALAWSEYLETHAQRAYGSVSQPEISVAKAILRRIKKGDLPKSFSSRDVWRPGWAKLTDREQVKEALRLLEDYNWITRERIENTGGRPKTVFCVNEKAEL